MSDPFIAVHETGRGWRWTYRDPAADIVLNGNQDFGSAAEASDAAARAYPGIPVRPGGPPVEAETDVDTRGRLLLKLIGGLLAAAGLVLLLRWIATLDDD